MRRAPSRSRHLDQAELARLAAKLFPEVEVPGTGSLGGDAAVPHYFRSYFIAWPTNANTAMH
jgi:hypothetical protein